MNRQRRRPSPTVSERPVTPVSFEPGSSGLRGAAPRATETPEPIKTPSVSEAPAGRSPEASAGGSAGQGPAAAGNPPSEAPGAGTPTPDSAAKDDRPRAADPDPENAGAGAKDAGEGAGDAGEGAKGAGEGAKGAGEGAKGAGAEGAGDGATDAGDGAEGADAGGEAGVGPVGPANKPDDLAGAETIVLSAVTEPPPRRQPGGPRRSRGRWAEQPDERPQPSWGTVLATTLRLWAQRRLGRLRSQRGQKRPRWRWAALVAVVLAVAVAAAVTVAIARGPGTGHKRTGSAGSGHNPGIARARAEEARQEAAAWASQQVSNDAIVACDPAMCTALQAQGFPASRLLVLRTGQADPLGSDVLMATAAVRNEFGSRLAGVYAPVILAVFGSGAARIDVRVVAPDGAPDYLQALSADAKARVTTGSQLAQNPHIHTTAASRAQLAAGLVDSRLLATLAALAAQHGLEIIGFGDLPGRDASPGVPLRAAVITWAPQPLGLHQPTVRSLLHFLQSQRPPYRPSAVKEVTATAHKTVLRIEYSAPSPLGLLG
jgi:hypothetical protein